MWPDKEGDKENFSTRNVRRILRIEWRHYDIMVTSWPTLSIRVSVFLIELVVRVRVFLIWFPYPFLFPIPGPPNKEFLRIEKATFLQLIRCASTRHWDSLIFLQTVKLFFVTFAYSMEFHQRSLARQKQQETALSTTTTTQPPPCGRSMICSLLRPMSGFLCRLSLRYLVIHALRQCENRAWAIVVGLLLVTGCISSPRIRFSSTGLQRFSACSFSLDFSSSFAAQVICCEHSM